MKIGDVEIVGSNIGTNSGSLNVNEVIGLKNFYDIFDLKVSIKNRPATERFPWFRIDQDHTFSQTNWPDLFSDTTGMDLRAVRSEDNSGVVNFNVTSATKYDSNQTVELTLDADAEDMVAQLLEDLNFYSYDYNTGDSTINSGSIQNWGMVVYVESDIGNGAGAILTGTEAYINYTNSSIANTLSPNGASTKIGIKYEGGADAIGTISGAVVSFRPHRIKDSSTTARWRKKEDVTIMTPGQASSGAGRRDMGQGHWHNYKFFSGSSWGTAGPGGIRGDGLSFQTNNTLINNPIADNNGNGAPRTGKTTMPRNVVAYIYAFGGSYKS